MKVRRFEASDCQAVSKLFYETVHSVNAKDYTEEQLSVWASNAGSLKSRCCDLLKQFTLVAEADGQAIGFGSVDKDGCLDMLFVHKNYQRQGIASALCNELEKGFSAIKTFSSITAKPFFENRGYVILKSQEVERFGVKLKNFEMQKTEKNNVVTCLDNAAHVKKSVKIF